MSEEKLLIQMVSEALEKVKDNKEDFLKVFRFYCLIYFGKCHSLFTYPGSKEKMAEELNEIFDKLYLEKVAYTNKGYDSFIDVLGGAANSTIVLLDSLIISGVKKFYFNDIDCCIYNTHKNCKDKSEEMINQFSEFVRTKFIQPYGTIFLDRDTYQKIISEEIDEFYKLQSNKDYGASTTVRFMFLRELAFSGVLRYRKKEDGGGHEYSKSIYNMKRATNELFRIIPKIMKFSKLYNEIDIQFYNMDAFELLELDEFKNNADCLVNLDPPYVDEMQDDIDEDILKDMSDNELEDCTVNYNVDFKHIDLLKKFNKMNFIYNNNKHPIVEYYSNKVNASHELFNRVDNLSATKDKKSKIVQEYIVNNNSLINFS